MFKPSVRLFAPLFCLLALAACGDSTGPGGPSSEDVAGLYAVCNLRFTPDGGALPAVRIDTVAFEHSTDPNVIAPRLAIDPAPTFQLRYTPKGQFSLRTLEGSYTLSGAGVTLDFGAGARPGSLLLPDRLTFAFQPAPQTLGVEESASYSVTRADYAALAGVPEDNLAAQIQGKLTATLQAPVCS